MKDKILDLIGSSYFIALVVTGIIILFLPPMPNKYKAELVGKNKNSIGQIVFYPDLDHDGKNDKIEIIKDFIGRIGVIIYKNNKLVGQWNFDGEYVSNENPLIGDIDGDGLDELIIFSVFNETVIMNCFNPFTNKFYCKNRKITWYKKTKGKVDCSIYGVGFSDYNNDNIKEIYFAINSAFSTYPRRFFSLDLISDSLNISPSNCVGIVDPVFFDFTGDGNKEITFSSLALNNCDSLRKINDKNTWLMLFDKDFNYLIEPILTGHYPARLIVFPLQVNGRVHLLAFNNYTGTENYQNELMLIDVSGKIIKNKKIEATDEWASLYIYQNKLNIEEVFLVKKNGAIYSINSELNIEPQIQLQNLFSTIPYQIDLDKDGKDELIFINRYRETLTIIRNDFSDVIKTSPVSDNIHYCKGVENSNYNLLVKGEKYTYLYKYLENSFYYFKYILYPGCYLIVFFLVSVVFKLQQIRIRKRIEEEKRVAELQMMGIKNQMNPHFTLNIMNSIGSLFYKQDLEKANYVFGKYSRLLRLTIINADSNSITIKNEIDYVENYIMLEQFRFDNKFDYEIVIQSNVDMNQKIPKMLVHTFVENAIKHGLQHKSEKGKLEIEIGKTDKNIFIVIIDNGIGRKKAGEINLFSTGKGLQIMNQILELYFSLYQVKIDYQIIDLMGKNETTGTKIEIDITY